MNPLNPVEVERKSTRLNSSHLGISYAVFCLKKKHRRTLHPPRSHPPHGQPLGRAPAFPTRRSSDRGRHQPDGPRLRRVDPQIRFFFNDTATTEIYTLSLHDALPI